MRPHLTSGRRLAAAVGVALGVAATGAAAGGDGRLTLLLRRATQDGEDLTLHAGFVGGRAEQAWATTPPDDNIPHDTQEMTLRLDDGRVRGEVALNVQYVVYRFRVDAALAGGRAEGTYVGSYCPAGTQAIRGDLAGRWQTPIAKDMPAKIQLNLSSIYGDRGHYRHAIAEFTLRGGKADTGKLYSGVEGMKRGFEGTLKSAELDVDADRIAGTVRASIDRGDARHGDFSFELTGTIAHNFILGRYAAYLDGEPFGSRDFTGTVEPLAAPPAGGDGVYALHAERVLDGMMGLDVYLRRQGGRFVGGLARGGNAMNHLVDADKLTLAGGRVTGPLVVTVVPEAQRRLRSFPRSGRKIGIRLQLDAAVSGTALRGRHEGQYGMTQPLRGSAAAVLSSWADVRRREAFAPGRDWPCWRGPGANGCGVPTGRAMVHSLTKARLAWRSEARPLDVYRGFPYPIQSGYNGPIVAGGKVFLSYYDPTGPVVDEAFVAQALAHDGLRALGEAWIRKKFAIDADDVVLCVEAATGLTLWRAAFAGKSVNWGKQGRGAAISAKGGPHLVPCSDGRRVYVVGFTGRVHALDAAGGECLWESDIGPAHHAIEHLKARWLAARSIAGGGGERLTNPPTVADGVLVVANGHGGLIGMDAATGRKLWHGGRIGSVSGPVIWRHRGTAYVIADTACLDLRTGKELWRVDGAHGSCTVAVAGDLLVLSGGGRGREGINCWRMTPQRATKLWALPAAYSAAGYCSPLVMDGHVYTRVDDLQPRKQGLVCIELATGKVVGWEPHGIGGTCSSMLGTDGRVLYEGPCYAGFFMYAAAPQTPVQLGLPLRDIRYGESTTAAVADGRLLLRTNNGILCYDLRAAR